MSQMDFITMSQEDTKLYAMLWARDRNPVAMSNLKLFARCFAELCAFREAGKHKWTLLLGNADKPISPPYTWFDTALTWAVWARAHQVANTTGKVVYIYLEGDFTRQYGKVYPNSTRN